MSARKLLTLVAAGIATAALAAPAGVAWAGSGHSAASLPKLDLTVSAPATLTGLPTATAAWVGNVKKGDNAVLQVYTGDNPDASGDYSYFAGEVTNTPVNGQALGAVTNIAFDYKGPLGAGAPRISLGLSDGSYVYLSAGYSSKSLGDGWVQFNTDDRTGTQHNTLGGGSGPAVIWDSQGHAYTTDGSGTAWANMAVDHGLSTTIDSISLVQDENHGIVLFDNIRFDTGMFVQGGVKGAFVDAPAIP